MGNIGKIAEQLEKIIEIHKTFYNGGVIGADLARNIELYILECKPEKRKEMSYPTIKSSPYFFNIALKQWQDNMGGEINIYVEL